MFKVNNEVLNSKYWTVKLPSNIYLFKVNNRNAKKGVNDVIDVVRVSSLLTMTTFHTFFSVSIIDVSPLFRGSKMRALARNG